MAYNFGFFLKTYIGDYDRAVKLVESFNKFNEEALPLYIACPRNEVASFEKLRNENIIVFEEEKICQEIFHEDGMWSAGYLNQEIYKLAFWEMGECENYMCLDSDALFIRPFFLRDFMFDQTTPYTILVEDNDLKSDVFYNQMYWNGRMKRLEKIEDALDYHPYHMMTCHGMQILSAKVLQSLKINFMSPNGYLYKDIIQIAPYEFSWYNFWLQKTKEIPIYQIEPLFKTFHLKQHLIFSVLQGMQIENWAKGYVGIVVNSNYGVGEGEYDDLEVYNSKNADIPYAVVQKNYRFYKKLMRGMYVKHIIQKTKDVMYHILRE
ncbi:MAG: DUF6492 family protein [Agathobacter sp.]